MVWVPFYYRGVMLRVLKRTTAGCLAAVPVAALYYRPDPSDPVLIEEQAKLSRIIHVPKPLSDHADEPDPIAMKVARTVVMGPVALLSRMLLFLANDTIIKKDRRYTKLLEIVHNRPPGQPLLTVCNHNSTLDDPGMFAAMVPWSTAWWPGAPQMRWGVCSQEICFANAGLSAFFGAGKVMPIQRGGGIDQRLLLDFARRMAAGGWCHIFPEGKTVQSGHLQGRPEERAVRLGRLKWGVGKLIAHSPQRPVVVPFFHTGMQEIIAEHPVTKDVLSMKPGSGKEITLRVGDPIEVDDLIRAHEAEHGPLWKYHANAKDDPDAAGEFWKSSETDKLLYHVIALRIEGALLALEQEARQELGPRYPEWPEVVKSGKYKALEEQAEQNPKAGGF